MMKLLMVSSEIYPFAKTGGLADVVYALSKSLKNNLNIDICLMMPKYSFVKQDMRFLTEFKFLLHKTISCKLYTATFENMQIYFVKCDDYFDRPTLYGYKDDAYRFAAFCKAVLKCILILKLYPHIIHCHEWQTALIPAYIKYACYGLKKIKTVLSIHNLEYQGSFASSIASDLRLPAGALKTTRMLHRNCLNFLKGGISYSDAIVIVSENYAIEVQTSQYGCGLNNFLRTHRTKLYGILNGIDNDVWNPRVDNHIFKNYDARTLKLKSQNKLSLQKELGLEVNPNIALLGMVCRLSEQKGLDILVPVISKITKNTQLVLLGKGDKYYEDKLISIKSKKLKNLSISIVFDETLAHKIYAAADIFLMPSRYEPCGLGQMISFRYGTIPVARRTGGLADTIIDVDSDSIHGTGFLFENYSSKDFFHTIKRALNYFKNKRFWYKLQKRVMQLDYSWNRSAYKYCELYKNLIKS